MRMTAFLRGVRALHEEKVLTLDQLKIAAEVNLRRRLLWIDPHPLRKSGIGADGFDLTFVAAKPIKGS